MQIVVDLNLTLFLIGTTFLILSFWHSRWMKLRNAMVPTTVLFEPLSLCFVVGLLASWGATYIFDVSPLTFMLVHTLFWFLLDYTRLKQLEVSIALLWIYSLLNAPDNNLILLLFQKNIKGEKTASYYFYSNIQNLYPLNATWLM
jgi:hypothetical protein